MALVCTIGDLLDDVVVWLDSPIARATDTSARIERRRGGSAANVAAFCAAQTGRARLVANVGTDPSGDRLVATMGAAGVDVVGSRRGRTGTVVVIVDPSGERTMLTDRGDSDSIAPFEPSWLEGAKWLHVPAYSLFGEPLATTAVELASAAHDRGIGVSVDTSSVALIDAVGVEAYWERLRSVRPGLLLANADEAARIGDVPRDITTIIKRGPDPAIVCNNDGIVLNIPVRRVDHVRDTTGAGDAFAAGVLVALVGGASLASAVERGHDLAAQVLTQPGATLVSDSGTMTR